MAFCTDEQVRATNKKLAKETDVPTSEIDSRITEADDTIISDLSSLFSEAELLAMGSGNKQLNLLSIWKSTELILAFKYGASRSVDTINDIVYWQGKYNDLLKKILDGDVQLRGDDGTTLSPIDYPVFRPSAAENAKFYPQKGVTSFTPEGGKTDTKDDNVK